MKKNEIFQSYIDNFMATGQSKYYHINNSQFIDLLPIDIGFGKTNELNVIETYPYYSLQYLIEGEMVLVLNEKHYSVKKGQLFIVPPNIPANYYNKKNNQISFLWLNFSGLNCDEIINLTAFSENPVINTRNKKQIYSLLMQCVIHCNYPTLQKIVPLQTLYTILHLLILEYDNYKTEPSKKRLTDFQSILYFINTHLFAPEFNATFVCNNCFITPEHLSRLFVKNMNMHLTSYVNIERIKLASTLLIDTDLSVKQIALKTGYRDVFYFCKVFKKYRLYTPSEYRLRKKNSDLSN